MTPAWTPDVVTPNLERAVHYTLLWGLEGVALRTVGGAGDRVPFVNEAAVRRRLDDAELPVVAVDPGVLEGSWAVRAGWLNDLALLDEAAAFAGRLGCGLVRVGALGGEGGAYDDEVAAAALREAGDVAGERGVRLAVRNAVGTGLETGAALAALLAAAAHPAVGADWRPADVLATGERPSDGLDGRRRPAGSGRGRRPASPSCASASATAGWAGRGGAGRGGAGRGGAGREDTAPYPGGHSPSRRRSATTWPRWYALWSAARSSSRRSV